MVIPGTHYTLHWFMQCKISDPSHIPEFKYVPISTGASSLPFGTAPYVPTVQISQTKSDWVVVPQESFILDARTILQCLAKTLNQHNFTIFDARDMMHSLPLRLPLISHEETICELEFLERQRKGIVVSYQNRNKRKSSPVKIEGSSPSKKARVEEGTSAASATRMLLDLLNYGPVTIHQAAQQFQVKEKLVENVVEVLSVVGQVTLTNNVIYSTNYLTSSGAYPPSPNSPTSPLSCSEDSYGPIPETPPQSMPLYDFESPSTLSSARPYATRSSTKVGHYSESRVSSLYQPLSASGSVSLSRSTPYNLPPPTQPARSREQDRDSEEKREMEHDEPERSWVQPLDMGCFNGRHEIGFEAPLDCDASVGDFFNSGFWDQHY